MSEKELLELAALAAGMPKGEYCEPNHEPSLYHSEYGFWQPLSDDGDEARLEATCNIDIEWHTIGVVAILNDEDLISHTTRIREPFSDHGGDKQKARRYAGVRAAAEIGKAMQARQGASHE